MKKSEKTEKLKKIKEEILTCQKCSLRKFRNDNSYYPVIGEGNHNTDIMFVGEAPGLQEARKARPFCGKAGKVLDELLAGMGVERESVYIVNILKDRPPQNRDPLPEEISSCSPYLEKQIEIIEPKIVCALGRYSMKFLMENYNLEGAIEPISKIHGKIFTAEKFSIMPLYHPAVATYNPNMKETLANDFEALKDFKKK